MAKYAHANISREQYAQLRRKMRKYGAWHKFQAFIYETMPAGRVKAIHGTINARAEKAAEIAEHAENGMLHFHVWQRDCDHASWNSVSKCPANVSAYNAYLDDLYEYAEGPVRVTMISAKEYNAFGRKDRKGVTKSDRNERDYILEAYEDGHPHSVRC